MLLVRRRRCLLLKLYAPLIKGKRLLLDRYRAPLDRIMRWLKVTVLILTLYMLYRRRMCLKGLELRTLRWLVVVTRLRLLYRRALLVCLLPRCDDLLYRRLLRCILRRWYVRPCWTWHFVCPRRDRLVWYVRLLVDEVR